MDIKRVYFVCIGGICMAALARYYMSKGYRVAGYDRTESALTDELVSEGAVVSYTDSMEAVPEIFRDPDGTLVVYTPGAGARQRDTRQQEPLFLGNTWQDNNLVDGGACDAQRSGWLQCFSRRYPQRLQQQPYAECDVALQCGGGR